MRDPRHRPGDSDPGAWGADRKLTTRLQSYVLSAKCLSKRKERRTFLLEKNKVNSSLADNDDRNFSSVLELEGCSDILEGMNNNDLNDE